MSNSKEILNDNLKNLRSTKMNNSKIGRNEPCPCGSGTKYKKCCLDLTVDSNPNMRPSTIVKIGIGFLKSQIKIYTNLKDYSTQNSSDLLARRTKCELLMLDFLIPDQEKEAVNLLENWYENIAWIDQTQQQEFQALDNTEEISEMIDEQGNVVTDNFDDSYNNLVSTKVEYSVPSFMIKYINSAEIVIPPQENIKHTLGELKTALVASRLAPLGLEPEIDDEFSTYAVCTVEPILLSQHRNFSMIEREILTEIFRSPYFISAYFKRVIFGSEDEWQLIPKDHFDNLLWCCSDKFNSEDLFTPITFRVSISRESFFDAFGESYLKNLYKEDGLHGFLCELGVKFLPQGIMRNGCIPDPDLKSNISNLLNFLNEDSDVINSFLAEFDKDIIMTYSMNKMVDVDRIIDIYGTNGYTPSQYDNAEKVSEWMSVYRPVLSKRDLVELN
jgi:hypothetical protein